MKESFQKRLAALAKTGSTEAGTTIAGGLKGVEKESLRVDDSGRLSLREHPAALGSALTNPYITTDFSEALLEFVTPALRATWETLRSVCDIHQFTYARLDGEQLWAASMPCGIPEQDDEIPLARYGDSNVGKMKTIYRRGLGYRYGRHMQLIAGVHFNYSPPAGFWPAYRDALHADEADGEFRSARYMGLVRNFRRVGWLLLYLFGASPALCKSFTRGDGPAMQSLNKFTWYEPYATSLRMSDLGYNNKNQARIKINLNSVDEYIRDLTAAIHQPEPDYEKIGVKVNGKYRQLNANLLQIENEYYSSIRPKRVAYSGERPTAALRRGGVEYVEIRALDINLFDPCGVNQNTMRFIEALLLYCLLESSPPIDEAGLAEASRNQLQVARSGRDPALVIHRDGNAVGLRDWSREILENVAAVAEVIDGQESGSSYSEALSAMRELVENPDSTPSARILEELRTLDSSYFDFVLAISESHRDYFGSLTPLAGERLAELERAAEDSIERQREIEAADTLSFDEYLQQYFDRD